ncbi:MAG: transposase [Lachnospiraceae bacterium]|nr:transposase [Lachnospiraceae bacterium]
MSKKPFTAEEIFILRQNPFTYKVTNSTLSFTKEFKELFITEYNSGITPRQILASHGYDPEILGDRRIWGISQHLRAQYEESGGSFSVSSTVSRRTKNPNKQLSEKDELKRLRQEVDYLKQEIEFLKKISSIRTTRK